MSVLQLVDIHLSTAFAGFDGALPDKEQTTVYVANEEVKVALQSNSSMSGLLSGHLRAR